jgi:hypothetical protein
MKSTSAFGVSFLPEDIHRFLDLLQKGLSVIAQLFEGMVIKRGVIHMLETLMPELSTQFAKIENNHAKIKQLTETIDKTQKNMY